MSSQISLSALSAYVDGELTAAEVQELETDLAQDTEAQRILAELQGGNRLARAAYDDPEVSEVPEALRESVEALFTKPSSAWQRFAGSWRQWLPRPRFALSCALVLLAMAVGYTLAEWRFEQRFAALEAQRLQDRQMLERAIAQALETQVSGEAVVWRNPDSGSYGEVSPLRTFKANNGAWCREYRETLVLGGIEETRQGVACRSPSGVWQTRLRILGDS